MIVLSQMNDPCEREHSDGYPCYTRQYEGCKDGMLETWFWRNE